jgi:putative oxidoreductase
MVLVNTVLNAAVTPLLLRLGLAVIFVYHGSELVFDPGNEYGANWMKESPSPQPAPVQLAVAWGQLLGGIALGLGFLTRLAALGIAIIMVGAIATVHWPKGFSLLHGGYEYNFALIVMCLPLILAGGGWLALDRLISVRLRRGRSEQRR